MSQVKQNYPGAEPFELDTLEVADQPMCANPECSHSVTDPEYTLTLGADWEGMAMDYGDVGFCSFECVEAFNNLETLREVDEDLLIRTGFIHVVEIKKRGVILSTHISNLGVEGILEVAKEELLERVKYGHNLSELETNHLTLEQGETLDEEVEVLA